MKKHRVAVSSNFDSFNEGLSLKSDQKYGIALVFLPETGAMLEETTWSCRDSPILVPASAAAWIRIAAVW